MARFSRASHILQAVEVWKDRCLASDGSVFTEKTLWTLENVGHLDKHFVQNLAEGKGDFLQKLQSQLSSAPSGSKQLAAEMFWIMFIYIWEGAMRPETKRLKIKQIWEWSGEPIPELQFELDEVLKNGVGNPGTAYNTHRWREFLFFVLMLKEFKKLAFKKRQALLSDPWDCATWIDGVNKSEGRQLRHILLFFLFPDHYERISTGNHKKQIVRAFRKDFGEEPDEIDYTNRIIVDKELLRIRKKLEEKEEGELDFYQGDIRNVWKPEPSTDEKAKIVLISQENAGKWYFDYFGNNKVWMLAAGEGGRFWTEFKRDGIVAIGWDSLGDLSEYSSKHEILTALGAERSSGSNPTMSALACYQFAHEMKAGDHLLIKRGRSELLGHGIIASDYQFDVDRAEYQHVRMVEWKKNGNWTIPEGHHITNKTLTDFTEYKQWLHLVFKIMENKSTEKTVEVSIIPFSRTQALDNLFLNSSKFAEIETALARKLNVILEGPPGVGKTFLARRLAWTLIGYKDLSKIQMVQFHQSYSYDDFIRGWRPNEEGGFELRDGVFHTFCRRASQDLNQNYVFIIDEINRANLSKVFGEVLMLIEVDKRGPDFSIPLTYSKSSDDLFYVPPNLYLIGMMNTADRSLAMVDYALRRRFSFVRLEPAFNSEAFQSHLITKGIEEILVSKIINNFNELNETIRNNTLNLGAGFEIGHSFFCPTDYDEALDESWYETVIHTEIKPLLHEYWFDQPDEVEKMIKQLLQ